MQTIQEVPAAHVTQRHLSNVDRLQRGLIGPHLCWLRARFDACFSLAWYGAVPFAQLWPFYTQSLMYFQLVKEFESSVDDLKTTLGLCGHRCEIGEFVPDHDPLLVRRRAGRDDYPLDLIYPEQGTVMMTKDENHRYLWLSGNCQQMISIPLSEAIGKSPDQVLSDSDGARVMLERELEALKSGLTVSRESLIVQGRTLDRMAIRFALPPQHRDELGSSVVICFNAADALRFPILGESKVRRRVPSGGSPSPQAVKMPSEVSLVGAQ